MSLVQDFRKEYPDELPTKSSIREANYELFEKITNEFGSWDMFVFKLTHNMLGEPVVKPTPEAAPKATGVKSETKQPVKS